MSPEYNNRHLCSIYTVCCYGLEPLNFLILEIPAFPALIFLFLIGIELSGDIGLTPLFFILLIYYFFLGAIIGLIVGKIKGR